uniref:EOG090X0J63 n=1 Tax=Scapholeberis mucronata TaxID=202097 RepID=A0A4Y7NMF2_9CRUS|nr:EOG090X0J63 [Scapholeberis mucronata]
MPKKFDGENSKVAVAKARKDAVKQAERKKKEEKEEEEFWKDDDKNFQKKLQRKDEKEKKKAEQLAKKNTLKALADEEMESIKIPTKQAPSKVSRLQIQAELEKREAAARGKVSVTKLVPVEKMEAPIPENINRIVPEGEVARSVEEAIQVLKINDNEAASVERHPEKRVKAAYSAFEERNLPRLREENPNMRLSQIKQMLHREWLKSPENPLNGPTSQYNKKP